MKVQLISLLILLSLYFTDCTQAEKREDMNHITAPLLSWNEGTAKKAIIDFVEKTTTKGNAAFIPVSDRIACFDNDGTLWSEQPMYFQLAFAIDQVKELAPQHPEWKMQQPFKAVLDGNTAAVLAGGEAALLNIVMATHAGISTSDFQANVNRWIKTARHPQTGMLYSQMVFQPMQELIDYLKANSYQVFIVSGGGVDFLRVWAEDVYGIPSHHIIGSVSKIRYDVPANGKPQMLKLPDIASINDKEAKPVAIWQHIGKAPVIAFGNSDGDYDMLQYTTTATGYPRLGAIIHHTDAEREFSYDRESHFGRLDKGINDAEKNKWLLVDMKRDWKTVYYNTTE